MNLDPLESRTAASARKRSSSSAAGWSAHGAWRIMNERRQHLHDVQLESRQKLWQWLIVAALGRAGGRDVAGRPRHEATALTEGVPA